MKLNLGCGRMVLDGYVNVDVQASPRAPRPPEIVGVNITNLDAVCPDGTVDEIMLIHVIEHFYRWEIPPALEHWAAKLRPDGALIIEAPDIIKCAQNLLSGKPDQMNMWGLYGDPQHRDPYMCHRWGWTPATLTPLLQQAGFRNIQSEWPLHHGRRGDRDFRLVARKPQ